MWQWGNGAGVGQDTRRISATQIFVAKSWQASMCCCRRCLSFLAARHLIAPVVSKGRVDEGLVVLLRNDSSFIVDMNVRTVQHKMYESRKDLCTARHTHGCVSLQRPPNLQLHDHTTLILDESVWYTSGSVQGIYEENHYILKIRLIFHGQHSNTNKFINILHTTTYNIHQHITYTNNSIPQSSTLHIYQLTTNINLPHTLTSYIH